MPNLLITRGTPATAKAEQRLEGSPRFPATVGPEDELIKVDLELPAANSVVRAHKPVLEVPIIRSASGTTDLAPCRNRTRIGCDRGTCL